ncbi:MAG: hypothetical protein APF76_15460 [Desulfitibacter sp. BRH_c19]|nr:MAG: hypothetical protein APF76_15460 [Desulfitibacter sp. BRH_c19]
MLQLTKVSKTYTSRGNYLPVIRDISLHVNKGEFVSLLGPSGSGKSTLFRIISGLVKAEEGKVSIDGQEVLGNYISIVGYMPQKDLLLPWRTLIQNAALPLLVQKVSQKEAYLKVRELLPVFGLEEFENVFPKQLSGGMRQRAALLRTVLIDSNLMLLDEPFAALDALTREKLQEWLMGVLQLFNKSVLFITHSIDEAIYLSDRIYVISHRPGEIVLELKVEIQRPRDRKIVTTKEFINYKEELLEALR